MVNVSSLGTRDVPLKLASLISKMANKEWKEGAFLDKVSQATRDLLRFWAPDGSFADLRSVNFHEGQWQAILNTIYVHEILKVKSVHDLYMSIYQKMQNKDNSYV